MPLNKKTVLLTGGTGSFGNRFVEIALKEHSPKKVIIFSRDEYKQYEMSRKFNDDRLRFFLGDVRDKERLGLAMQDVDIVIHAAALKQVPALEYNPFEAVRTNIIGGYNVASVACASSVKKVIALSTDKAANPLNLYGATKLCSDKIFVAANNFGRSTTKISVVRYGNVAESRGSVVPLFLEQRKAHKITITDERMTRFWITLNQAVSFVIENLERMVGGEIFVPKIPSVRMTDLVEALAPDCEREIIGIRPGEKLHELMIPGESAHETVEFDDYFVITPSFHDWANSIYLKSKEGSGRRCPEGFVYASNTNSQWLTVGELRKMYDKDETTPGVAKIHPLRKTVDKRGR